MSWLKMKLHLYTVCKFDRPLRWGSRQHTVKTVVHRRPENWHWCSATKSPQKRQNLATGPSSTELVGNAVQISKCEERGLEAVGYVGNVFGKLRGLTQKPLFVTLLATPTHRIRDCQ